MTDAPDGLVTPADARPPDPAGVYVAAGLGCLVVVGAVLVERAAASFLPLAAVVPAACGLALRVGWAAGVSVVLVAVFQVYPDGPPFVGVAPPVGRDAFRALDLALAAGVVGYLACQSRVLSLAKSAAPADPAGGAEFARPAAAVPADEVARLAVVVAAAVLAGQLAWMAATRVTVDLAEPPTLKRAADRNGVPGANSAPSRAVVAAGLAGLFAGAAGFWAWYTRWTNQSADQARAYLLDLAWRESRRELARQEAWRAARLAPPTPWVRRRVVVRVVAAAAVFGAALYVGLWALFSR